MVQPWRRRSSRTNYEMADLRYTNATHSLVCFAHKMHRGHPVACRRALDPPDPTPRRSRNVTVSLS
jgi:hypothetical protein